MSWNTEFFLCSHFVSWNTVVNLCAKTKAIFVTWNQSTVLDWTKEVARISNLFWAVASTGPPTNLLDIGAVRQPNRCLYYDRKGALGQTLDK